VIYRPLSARAIRAAFFREGTMEQFAWLEQVASLRAMLDTLDGQLADGDLRTAGLEELKSALDDLRLRAWGLLTAANSEDPHGFQERFRTRRGTEMCRALSSDVRTGRLTSRQADLPALSAAARDLAAAVKEMIRKPPEQVKKATRKPAKRRGKGPKA
jgi:hypothetical protein